MSVQFSANPYNYNTVQISLESAIAQKLAAMISQEPKENQRVFKAIPMYGYERLRDSTIDRRRVSRAEKVFEKRFDSLVEAKAVHCGATWKKFVADTLPAKHYALPIFDRAVDTIIGAAVLRKWEQVLADDDHSFEWKKEQQKEYVDQIMDLYTSHILPIKQKIRNEHSKDNK